jgi:hypothetical protein
MRSVLAGVLAAAALGGVAFAQAAPTLPTSAPGNAFTFQRPAKWPGLDLMSKPGDPLTVYVSGTANEECYFDIVPRPESAEASPMAVVKAWTEPLGPEKWIAATKGQYLLRGGDITVESSGVDTSKPFPVQTAILKGAMNRVVAAITARPGFEIWSMCTSYDGQDHTDKFRAAADSVSTPKDAEWEAAIAAAAAAPEPAPAPEEKGKNKNKS